MVETYEDQPKIKTYEDQLNIKEKFIRTWAKLWHKTPNNTTGQLLYVISLAEEAMGHNGEIAIEIPRLSKAALDEINSGEKVSKGTNIEKGEVNSAIELSERVKSDEGKLVIQKIISLYLQ